MEFIASIIILTAALLLTGAGIFCLFPKRVAIPRALGWLLTLAGVVALGVFVAPKQAPVVNDILFYLFSGGVLLSAVLMITSHNPVYGALWFALVTLSVCGLFLLQSAPFLAAATIIVYAGAIIVTFLFVIMLAQQSGRSIYDQRSRQPLLATITAFIMLGALLTTIEKANVAGVTENTATQANATQADTTTIVTHVLSRPVGDEPFGSMHGLGRSLFGDYLFAVELGGTLLLIASIGAIIISPRKEQGTL